MYTSIPLSGIAVAIAGSADNELSHTLYAATVTYTPRRITR